MEEQAQGLIQTLKRAATPVDQKLVQFNNLKSSIKHLRVPDAAQPAIFECVKIAIGSQASSQLVSSGFSTLGHLIKRLSLQNQANVVGAHAGRLFPVLLDRFGDARGSHRNAAGQILTELWTYCDKDVERLVRDSAITGSNARAKEMGMQWVVKTSKEKGLQFKGFVPNIVANLEDSDGAVRDVAKHAVIDLFRDAPDHAKTDLKKQLKKYDVRHSIASQILSQLGVAGSAPPAAVPEIDLGASTISFATSTAESFSSGRHAMQESAMSEAPPPVETVPMDPLYVHTQRELDDIFRDLTPHFEGKESEQNWMLRDKGVTKLRRLLKGNAPSDFLLPFIGGCRALQDGILKVVNSLRTTMSSNGCQFVQELARTVGPAIDPMVEIFLQNLIKMSAATKHIAAQNGNTTVDVIFQYASYHKRLMEHVWFACQDKNVQPRMFASGWLKTLIQKHSSHKAHFESSGGVDMSEKCLKKGMSDANPKVRENMRTTYWVFSQIWPQRAEVIMNSDDKIRKGLESDPRNPNASLASSVASSVHPFSKSLGASKSRPSLRDAIAAQRRAAMSSRQGPERPASAQSTFSPVKQPSTSNLSNRAPSSLGDRRPASRAAPSRTQSSTASVQTPSSSSISAAPMRRPRRPDINRPATADPYASRAKAGTSGSNVTPTKSSTNSPQKGTVKSTVTTARKPPTSTVSRPRTATSMRQSPAASPSKKRSNTNEALQHRHTPSVGSSKHTASPTLTPSKMEDLTIVMPLGKPNNEEHSAASFKKRMEKTMAAQQAGEEDGFTMVIPDLRTGGSPARERTPLKRSPGKAIAGSARLDLSASPRLMSPARLTPDVTNAQTPEVKVYEDPFVGDESANGNPLGADKAVLGELQLTEKDPNISLTLAGDNSPIRDSGSRTPSKSPAADGPEGITHDRAEILRNRRLLASGIERIRAKTLDAHGFRRVQDLVKSGQDIWGEGFGKFKELLFALLEFLESSTESLKQPPVKAQNLKTQVLATIRAMLGLYRKEFVQHADRALCSVLKAKQWVDDTSHHAADLDRTAEEICRYGRRERLIDAVLDLIDNLNNGKSPNDRQASPIPAVAAPAPSRTIATALGTLSQLLAITPLRPASPIKSRSRSQSPSKMTVATGPVILSPSQTTRLANAATLFLSDAEPDVRKADLEFCVALHDNLSAATKNGTELSGEGGAEGKDAFWKALREQGGHGLREQSLNLITYYVAKRSRV